jgi:hypothetical protein
MKKPRFIEINHEQLAQLEQRFVLRSLNEDDYELVRSLISTLVNLNLELAKKNISIKKLRNLFNIKTETSRNILDADKVKKSKPAGRCVEKEKKGHGRNTAASYSGARKVPLTHAHLKAGCLCPGCRKGKLYKSMMPGVFLRIKANPPFTADLFEQEKLRCNLCGEIFTASLPEGVVKEKYDETAGSMIALLRYGTGVPHNRIAILQAGFGIPLPSTTQWDLIEKAVNKVTPVYEQLVKAAAQGEVIHNDDTHMKILSVIKENAEAGGNVKRKGVFTTGVISKSNEATIVLYYTGRNHAGENMAELLKKRLPSLTPPIQMCDALARNLPKEFKTILANCLAHGRRKFVEIYENFPVECEYVIELLGKVYHNDAITKREEMSAEQRLVYHQINSGPLMNQFKSWIERKFRQKEVEPNSALGEANQYMLNHWEPLTLFLRVAGAPLDNNIVERALKKSIQHRKNSLFYKTEFGAWVGDVFMSMIETCRLLGVNAYEYLTILQKNWNAVRAAPAAWLPWNYLQNIPLPEKN